MIAKKYFVILLITTLFVGVFGVRLANAQTTETELNRQLISLLQQVIALLQKQVVELQKQLVAVQQQAPVSLSGFLTATQIIDVSVVTDAFSASFKWSTNEPTESRV